MDKKDYIRSIIREIVERIVTEHQSSPKESFSVRLKKILDSVEAYYILDNFGGGGTWAAGGCKILADALNKYIDIPIYVVFNTENGIIEHFMVKVNDMLLDYDGIQSATEILNKMKDVEHIEQGISILPYNKKMSSSDIPSSDAAATELIKLFEKNNL